MAQNKTQEKSLEQRLFEIASLKNLSTGIEGTKNVEERSQLYLNLAKILSGKDENEFENSYRNIRLSPEEAYRYAIEGIATRVEQAKESYNQEGSKITKEIISELKEILGDSKNKFEIALKLGTCLRGLYKISELDQLTANEYAKENSENKLGVSMVFDVQGKIDNYRPYHQAIQSRIYASKFLKEIKDKDGNTKRIELDENKIANLMEDIENAAMVYTNLKAIKQAKKKQKSK